MNVLKYHSAYTPSLQAARALLKFCEDHQRPYPLLNDCIAALETGDRLATTRAMSKIPFGGMGTFNDWIPPVVFEHETGDYVWTVFEALTERWYRLMKLLERFAISYSVPAIAKIPAAVLGGDSGKCDADSRSYCVEGALSGGAQCFFHFAAEILDGVEVRTV